MIKYSNKGNHYSDNLIDSLLSFNIPSTWTVTGTGTAALDNGVYFEGSGSLKVTNNDYQNTDLTANNTSQSTIIPFDGEYDFSLYLKKTLDEDMSIDVEIYNNASLIYDTTFDFSEDYIDEWTCFITNENFSLSEDDEITFKFKINSNASSAKSLTSLWVDGLHFYNKERNQIEPPRFNPVSDFYLRLKERGEPTVGTDETVIWTASGSGTLDSTSYERGDLLATTNSNGTQKTTIIIDFSAV